jgi:exopolysaccharide production protein ExoZ
MRSQILRFQGCSLWGSTWYLLTMGQEKLPGLQIARAVAALGIAYIHSWHVTMPFPPGTSYPIPYAERLPAVPLFFAISGFVICLIAAKPNFRPLPFLIRRAFRIYPLWIATSFIFLYLSLTVLGLPERSSPAFFIYSLTLLPTDGYPFYDLGWSLQHEFAFYILATLLVPRFGLAGLSVFLCTGVAADHVFTLPWYLHQYAGYYPSFLAGIAAFAANRHLKSPGFWIPIAAGIALLILSEKFDGGIAFPLALFLLLIGLVNIRADKSSWAKKVGVLLGDASYSIYLIHPLVFYFVYSRLQPPLPPIWSQEFLRFGSIATVCFIAMGSWRLFEAPIIRMGNSLISTGMALRYSELRDAGKS